MNKKTLNGPEDVRIGGVIRLRRMALNMSQGDLGAKLGISFQQIQKYEKGINSVAASALPRMAAALGVPVAYFYPAEPNDMAPAPMAADTLRVAFAYEAMTDERGKQVVRDVIKAFT